MKDKGEVITAVVLLGLGLSAIIRALVIGGSGFGSAACQNSSLGDCALSLFVFFWVVAAILVGSVYLALLIRRGVRHRHPLILLSLLPGFRAENSTVDSFCRCKISARFSARI
jgi:hypothetical protein